MNALIGYTGFVGGTLLSQTDFGVTYRSRTISAIEGNVFDTVVCAAAPAQKWIANRDPLADSQNIHRLIAHLKTVTCNTFVLISTVDVFKYPIGVDEDTSVDEEGLHAYGLHRRLLEKFIESHFPRHLIVRLPGLVGPGLRKNVIFDFLNDNNLQSIDSRGIFQFYPMVNLWRDIQTALQADLKLVHLTAEPISVAELSELGFGKTFDQPSANQAVIYDMRTRHAAVFGGKGHYQYSQRETLLAVRAYAQSEPKTLPLKDGGSA
ncbi:NAD(P)-dependent oxidoreductase [Undibacterium oligocarboniphilum]|uniref:NAD(P)-dependent oxidoreductase n=1 Tax=Undibacterium oligocarboniphilum TaxID=666702 RepID=A0A850QP63_9BURK|nr:NAD(P)-dependent oxidoreductase [Undibacterium oligocarboniphilum]MBC3869477.1 NAD(P)-dependent oxidoreductase [Undibacterium oligocarboniphilum]NVO77856.1 NAD(P)-dependent oxidoreductase [Undibacterium oligocarboniphilum]